MSASCQISTTNIKTSNMPLEVEARESVFQKPRDQRHWIRRPIPSCCLGLAWIDNPHAGRGDSLGDGWGFLGHTLGGVLPLPPGPLPPYQS